MAKFKTGQIVAYKDEPDFYSIKSVLEFPGSGTFYSIWKLGSVEGTKMVVEQNLTAITTKFDKEDNTMATTTNKTLTPVDYTATPEELERDKKIQEATEEAEKKILDIRIELAKTLEAIRAEYQEQEAIKREERQAHAWKRKYEALLKEGFSVEQAWEMTMKSFEVD